MKQFTGDDFLLNSRTAKRLFHEFSKDQPIIDFHCHLSPEMIAEDRKFRNLTQAWLEGDHYKWRAMRINGISEDYCTGKAPDKDKFMKWADTVPNTLGNPLYHWTHLELSRYFGINDLLSPANAERIYDLTAEMLESDEFSVRSLLKKMKVEVVCTTDDPADTLSDHARLANFEIKILPTFRPDNILKTEDPGKFLAYVEKLGNSEGIKIKSFESLVEVLDKRHQFFHKMGGRLSDHGLERFYFEHLAPGEAVMIFGKLIKGAGITLIEAEKFRIAIMLELCRMNHKRGWTQQFHVGAIRNNNTRKYSLLGPDTGWDSIGNTLDAAKMSGFLAALDETDQLGKTILYNLNPADNEKMITMAGNFNDGSYPAKVQYGAAWWFLDQKIGMEKHLRDLSSLALLPRFVGMVTDSRSFLSYPRHEYFRRILCNYIGDEVEKGLMPDDEQLLRTVVEGISYRNALKYFCF
jgi:glucuronate isomerase